VGDGYLISKKVEVRFDVIWRAPRSETVVATTTHTFEERPAGAAHFDAIAFETDMNGVAADARAGDQLVLKFSVISGDADGNYTPNGDGPAANGRYPNLTLP
jgi:hypothetical protein